MRSFVARRVLQAVPTLLGITLLSFASIHFAPGDPITLLVARTPDLSAADLAQLRADYGLDAPLPVQYVAWLLHTLRGDLGQSFVYKRPSIEVVLAALPNTLQLAGLSLVVSLVLGVTLGVLAARYHGTPVDHTVRLLAVAGHAIPGFWFGLLFILILSVQLRLLPVGGAVSIGADSADMGDRLRHLIGPVLTLSLAGIANYSRYTRTEMLEALHLDFVRTAWAKGLDERTVLYRHALRHALIPIVTALGGAMATLLSGAVVVEQVFAWPGMGRLAFDAARAKDYPLVMAVVLLSSVALLAGFLIRDLVYGVVDPRGRADV